jgi:hypothetical protein
MTTVYTIQVCVGSRWGDWDIYGGGDHIAFETEDQAREAALATGELLPENEGKTWRVKEQAIS